MSQDNPFARYAPAAPVQAGPIYSGVDPEQARREEDQRLQREAAARAARDQQLQEAAAARAARGEQREIENQNQGSIPSGYRRNAAGALEPIPGGPADPNNPSGQPTESENTAAFLATRASSAARQIAAVDGGQAPSLVAEGVRSVFGNTAANYITGSDRQRVEAAQIEFIDAALTLGTGAAYTAEQLEGYRRAYFPVLGDEQATIDDKRTRLRSLLEAARLKAGRAAPDIDAAIAAIFPESAEQRASGSREDSNDTTPGVRFSDGDGDTPFSGGTGSAYFDADGNEVNETSYTGQVFNADGQPDGYIRQNSDGEREWVPQRVYDEAMREDQRFGEYGKADLMNHGATLGLTDEIEGLVGGTIDTLRNGGSWTDNYARNRDAEQLRIDMAREREGAFGTVAEGFGGMASIAGRSGGLLRAGRAAAARNGGQVTRTGIRDAMRREATRDGAFAGALAGFGYGEGLEGSATNALLGGTVGAAFGNVTTRGVNALAARAERPLSEGAIVQQSADRLGIDTLPAMTGGRGTRVMTSGAQQGFISSSPIQNAAGRIEAQAGQARTRIAENVGEVVDSEDAGEIVRRAANVYSRRTSDIGGRLYERADRLAGDTRAPLPEATATARRWMAEVAQDPGGAESSLYRNLQRLADQMETGEFTIAGVRSMRTRLREEVQERGLRGNITDKIYSQIVEAAQNDITNALTAAGNQRAAQALTTANKFWQQRVATIDEVLEPVLGKNTQRSGEQITRALERMADPNSGNAQRLRRLMEAMPKEEANSFRATVINRMGRPNRGAGDVIEEDSFSLATFLTSWNNMTPRARNLMFPPEVRDALTDLANVAAGAKRAGNAMNSSNTAGALVSQGVITGGLAWLANPAAAALGAAGQYGAGRLLSSPRFARWLAGAPRNAGPEAQSAYIARLTRIARAEPALAPEIDAFRRAITASNDNTAVLSSSVAEEPGEQEQRQR